VILIFSVNFCQKVLVMGHMLRMKISMRGWEADWDVCVGEGSTDGQMQSGHDLNCTGGFIWWNLPNWCSDLIDRVVIYLPGFRTPFASFVANADR
jgi:hypothetical protein